MTPIRHTPLIVTLAIILATHTTLLASQTHDDHDDHDSHESRGMHESHDDHDDHGDHESHGDHGDHDDHDEGIQLSPAVRTEFDIQLESASLRPLVQTLSFPGEIRVNEDRQAHIVPRYPGLVTEVRKHVGDEVHQGDVLAILEGNESLTPYALKSLIDGTIIDKHITLGESLSNDDIVFTVANLETVWVDLTIYQKDLPLIQAGQPAGISGGEHLPSETGAIAYVSPAINRQTRTGLARVVLPNTKRQWRPGTFVTGNITVGQEDASLAIPRTAVIAIEGRPSIFVETDHGIEARTVTLGAGDDTVVQILTGLTEGERYVSRHVLPLKAELNRAALEHAGHAH